MPDSIELALEIGQSRVFAMAVDWPGWCRAGRDEARALQALQEYAPRYARALRGARLSFPVLAPATRFTVVARAAGNATTDFGAPDAALPGDDAPVDDAELRRFQRVLRACWRAFDAAAEQAEGRALRKGPRGGGRELAAIREHVQGVDAAYLARLGGKAAPGGPDDPAAALALTRQAILETLALAAHGQISARGPRGGVRWTPRYFVRRLAWHELDHAWEIEDRTGN